MKTILSIFLFCLIYLSISAQPIVDSLVWAKSINAVGLGTLNIHTDSHDNIVVVGSYENCDHCFISFDSDTLHTEGLGGFDIFLAKLSSTGELIASTLIGGAENEFVAEFDIDNNNQILLYVNASFAGFTFDNEFLDIGYNLLKIDENFELIWDVNIKGTFHEGLINSFSEMLREQFSVSNQNEILIGGEAKYATNGFETINVDGDLFEVEDSHIFIMKIREDGSLAWIEIFESSGSNIRLTGLEFDKNHEVIVYGDFIGADFIIENDTLQADTSISSFHTNLFVLKLSSDGEKIWAKQFFTNTFTRDIAIGDLNDIFLLTRIIPPFTYHNQDTFFTSDNAGDFLFFKITSDGFYEWGTHLVEGNGTNDNGYILANSEDQIYISGELDPHLGPTLQKHEVDGSFSWAMNLIGSSNRTGGDITFDYSGNLIQTGMFTNTLIIGDEIVDGIASNWQPYILKFRNQTAQGNEPVSTSYYDFSEHIKVFPNPASHALFVEHDFTIVENVKIVLSNAIGQIIEIKSDSTIREGRCFFDTTKLPSGIYFIHVLAGDQIIEKTTVAIAK